MKHLPWMWPGVLGLLIGSGAATAAPTAAPAPTTATDQCPVPDKATCLSKTNGGLGPAYLETACGKKHKATCKPFVEDGLQNDPEFKRAPSAKMLRPNGTDIPKDLKDGKRRAYKPASVMAQKGTHLPARTRMTSPPAAKPITVDQVKNVIANPAWGTNGQNVTSCAEYAYKRYWDWTRFADATAACKGDKDCIIDVAMLPSTPGIADRTLERRDGTNLPNSLQVATTSKTVLPKNLFFAVPNGFLDYAPSLDPALKKPMLADMKKGAQYYGLCKLGGTCGGAVKVGSEWGFHRNLHDKNRHMSEAEFQEYERRKRKLHRLVSEYFTLLNMLYNAGKKPQTMVKGWVSPLDELANPMQQLQQVPQQFTQAAVQLKALNLAPLSPQTPQATPRTPGASGALDRGKLGGDVAAAGVLAMPRPGSASMDLFAPTAGTNVGGKVSKTCPKIGSTGTPNSATLMALQCHIGQALVKEYERKLAGQKSCLDLDSTDCDWSPSMFTEELVTGVPHLPSQAADEQHCLAWTKNKLGPYDKNGVPKDSSKSIAAVDEYIAFIKAEMAADDAKQLAKLKAYEKGVGAKGKKFGTDLGEAEAYGDKSMFAAGYDYVLGWGVEPSALEGSDVCKLGGHARGGFGVDAWLIGNEIEIVDGLAAAAFNGGLTKNGKGDPTGAFFMEGKNNKAYGHAHLRVLGQQVIDPPFDKEFNLNQVLEPADWRNRIDIPAGYKPSFTIMAGPVPITGAVWAEFFYGASFAIQGEINANCKASEIKLIGRGIFTPELGVDGRAQVGVGISGLLSVGIRGALNLVTVGVPVTNELQTAMKKLGNQLHPSLKFSTKIGLSLATLSGWLSLYVEFLFLEEEFEIIRWTGLSTVIDLMPPITADLRIGAMTK